MAILRKNDPATLNHADTTIIAAGTRIKGEIESKCRIHVDGEFSGPICSDNTITIGKAGFIEGDLYARELVVTGRFSGTAICETVRILAGGKIVGRVTSNILQIERGCIFHGQNIFKEAPWQVVDSIQGKSPLHKVDNRPDYVTAIPIASERAVG